MYNGMVYVTFINFLISSENVMTIFWIKTICLVTYGVQLNRYRSVFLLIRVHCTTCLYCRTKLCNNTRLESIYNVYIIHIHINGVFFIIYWYTDARDRYNPFAASSIFIAHDVEGRHVSFMRFILLFSLQKNP